MNFLYETTALTSIWWKKKKRKRHPNAVSVFFSEITIFVYVLTGLLDPKWMESRQRSMADKSDQEEVYAPGSAIDSNLKQLAERRTDIFGLGTEETQIGKKVSLQFRYLCLQILNTSSSMR